MPERQGLLQIDRPVLVLPVRQEDGSVEVQVQKVQIARTFEGYSVTAVVWLMTPERLSSLQSPGQLGKPSESHTLSRGNDLDVAVRKARCYEEETTSSRLSGWHVHKFDNQATAKPKPLPDDATTNVVSLTAFRPARRAKGTQARPQA